MKTEPKTFFQQQVEQVAKSSPLKAYHYVHVRQSRALMKRYCSEPFELDRMAAAAFMSRFHYIRIFQQVYGVTPGQHMRSLRIEKAKDLLKTGLPVTQVCLEVGYDSLPTFSKVFKDGTGCSPRAYQKANKSNPE